MKGLIALVSTLIAAVNLPLLAGAHEIEGNLFMPDPDAKADWKTRTRILLDGGLQEAYVKRDGSFKFYDISSGSHKIEVFSTDYIFPGVVMEVTDSGDTSAHVNNYISDSTPSIPYPLKLHPMGKQLFFAPRKGWSPIDLLKNPMVLMMLAMGAMGVFLPKMIENMDPEMQEEMKTITPRSAMAELLGAGSDNTTNNAPPPPAQKKKGKKNTKG
eukprot:CFRG5871T1